MPNSNSTAATVDRTIKEARPIDDVFSRSLFKGQDRLVEKLLRAILRIPDLRIVHMETQSDLKTLGRERSLVLDIYAVDSTGRIYDIELQCNPSGADAHRARFHLSLLDRGKLGPGDEFRKLPDTCVIFITEEDCIGDGELFHRFRYRDDHGNLLETGQEIWYVNASFTGTPPAGAGELADWAHDFLARDADDMRVPELAERVRFFKDEPEGRREMASTIEMLFKERDEQRDQVRDEKRDQIRDEKRDQIRDEKRDQVRDEQRDREREKELARSLYKGGASIELLVSSLAISEAEIRAACGLMSK